MSFRQKRCLGNDKPSWRHSLVRLKSPTPTTQLHHQLLPLASTDPSTPRTQNYTPILKYKTWQNSSTSPGLTSRNPPPIPAYPLSRPPPKHLLTPSIASTKLPNSRNTNLVRVHSASSRPRYARTTRFSSHAETTGNSSQGLRHSIATATWCWRM